MPAGAGEVPGTRHVQRRQEQAGQAEAAASMITRDHLASLDRLINHLRKSSNLGSMNPRREEVARRIIRDIRALLQEIAAVSGDGDPIQGIVKEWRCLVKRDLTEGERRPRLSVRLMEDPPAVMDLAKRTQSLLVEKRPEGAHNDQKAATRVQPVDISRLERLAILLGEAVTPSPLSPHAEEEIRNLGTKTWRRLLEIAAADGEDTALLEILRRWRQHFRIEPESHRAKVNVRELVRAEGDAVVALVQETEELLGRRRPDGA